MAFPEGPTFVDELIGESEGRVRAVRLGRGRWGFQDPDIVVRRTFSDGSTRIIRNVFIGRSDAISRLAFDFEGNRLVDSFGRNPSISSLKLPLRGESFTFQGGAVSEWKPLDVDPRRIRPDVNQEIVERVVFVNRDGSLTVRNYSYGRGERYDRSLTGTKWRADAARALGETSDPGEGKRRPTRELSAAMAAREFLIRTTT